MSEDVHHYSSDDPHGPDELGIMHHTELPTTKFSEALDGIIRRLGEWTSWLWLLVMVTIILNVVMRYAFEHGSIALEEFQWHVSSFVWMLGMSYTFISDHHVRVDVIHERLSLKAQAWIELLGLVFLLLPFLVVVIYYGLPYAHNSWALGETSQAPSGLPYRWILKFMIPISLFLIAVTAVSRLAKCTALLFGFPKPIRVEKQ